MHNKLSKMHRLTYPLTAFLLTACGGGSGSNQSSQELPEPTTQTEPTGLKALIEWNIPTVRENGKELLLSEIDGYEIMYKKSDDDNYTTLVINEGSTSQYEVSNLSAGEYEVKIAAFDTDGLYSNYSESAFSQIGD